MRLCSVILASALALAAAAPAHANGFMKIPDIAGESARAGHEGEIDISSVSYAIDGPAAASVGAGRTRARATVGEFLTTKFVDAASPYIALAAFQQKNFKEIVIDMTQSTGAGAEQQYYTITLTNATISSVDTVIDASGDSQEIVGFRFEKININYVESRDDGSAGDEHEIEYDLASGA